MNSLFLSEKKEKELIIIKDGESGIDFTYRCDSFLPLNDEELYGLYIHLSKHFNENITNN